MKNCSLPDNPKTDILIAPNAFKGTLKAQECCRILSEEFRHLPFRIRTFPMCDGGDDSAEIIASYTGALPLELTACDALGRKRHTRCYVTDDTAILDLASVCGIKDLHPREYDVLNANTAGLGIVLSEIIAKGYRRILLGLGGSASVDGGTAALETMGLKIVTCNNYRNRLIGIQQIDATVLKENFKGIDLTLLCDVDHPLCGEKGAAKTFGPQKGASFQQTELLDRELIRWANLICAATGREITSLKHGGAAGGVAGAFAALLGARLISGSEYCLRLSRLEAGLSSARLLITGEGKLDDQSIGGKLPGTLAALCSRYQVAVVAVTGSSDISSSPFQKIYQLIDFAANLPDAMRQPGYYLRQIARVIQKDLLNSAPSEKAGDP